MLAHLVARRLSGCPGTGYDGRPTHRSDAGARPARCASPPQGGHAAGRLPRRSLLLASRRYPLRTGRHQLSPGGKSVYRQQHAPGAFAISPEVFKHAQQFELEFVRAGGLLAAGVDPTGNGGALPGFGDQRNFELLIEAGFTPVEAIRIMTLNGAILLGEDKRLGSVTPGKLADLVVIKGDPISKPAEIRNVAVVFKDGVGYDPAKLIEACRGLVGIR